MFNLTVRKEGLQLQDYCNQTVVSISVVGVTDLVAAVSQDIKVILAISIDFGGDQVKLAML